MNRGHAGLTTAMRERNWPGRLVTRHGVRVSRNVVRQPRRRCHPVTVSSVDNPSARPGLVLLGHVTGPSPFIRETGSAQSEKLMQEVSTEVSPAVVARFFAPSGPVTWTQCGPPPHPMQPGPCAASSRLRGCGPVRAESWTGSSPRYPAASTWRCPWCKTFTGSFADGEYASLSGPPTPGPATAAVTTVTMPAPSGSLPDAGLDRLNADGRQRGAPLTRLSSTAGARRDGSGRLR